MIREDFEEGVVLLRENLNFANRISKDWKLQKRLKKSKVSLSNPEISKMLESRKKSYQEFIGSNKGKLFINHPTLSEIMPAFLYHIQCFRFINTIMQHDTSLL